MKDLEEIWESYDPGWEKRLDELRASLERGKLGISLTDLFRDDPEDATDESGPVKVTYAMLHTPLVKELEDGSRVPNFLRHWSQEPGERLEKESYGYSIQHAMAYDSPVATAADKVGAETNVPGTIHTVIVDLERDPKFEANIKHKQAMNKSAAADAMKWKHD